MRLLPGRHLHGEAAVGVEHERGAVEHQFVLAADLVDVDQRQARLGHARHGDVHAQIGLGPVEGRAVGQDQDLRARLLQALARPRRFQMSSQIGTPMRTPRKPIGPGIGPASNTRFSSNTP